MSPGTPSPPADCWHGECPRAGTTWLHTHTHTWRGEKKTQCSNHAESSREKRGGGGGGGSRESSQTIWYFRVCQYTQWWGMGLWDYKQGAPPAMIRTCIYMYFSYIELSSL